MRHEILRGERVGVPALPPVLFLYTYVLLKVLQGNRGTAVTAATAHIAARGANSY